jgi:hypothetical protein
VFVCCARDARCSTVPLCINVDGLCPSRFEAGVVLTSGGFLQVLTTADEVQAALGGMETFLIDW